MDSVVEKFNAEEMSALMKYLRVSKKFDNSTVQFKKPEKLDLMPVDVRLDGPETYLSWSRRVESILENRNLEGYISGTKIEPEMSDASYNEWKTTQSGLYAWLLNSMTPQVYGPVESMRNVRQIWEKLKEMFAGIDNKMRVFQIEESIDLVEQGDRSIQEYAWDLQRLWADYDYFSPHKDCGCGKSTRSQEIAESRTVRFRKKVNSAFHHRRAILLSGNSFPSLSETIAAMVDEESRLKLHARLGDGLPGAKSALVVGVSNHGAQSESRKCYNRGEIGHLKWACPKPSKDRENGIRGRFGARGRGFFRSHGRRGGGMRNYRANMTVGEEEDDSSRTFTEDEVREILEKYGNKKSAVQQGSSSEMNMVDSSSSGSNLATFTHSHTGTAFSSNHVTKPGSWIVDSGASRHLTGCASELSTYTPLAVPESIQTADGTFQPVVGKGTIVCTKRMVLSNVLHSSSFPVNILSISAIILQLNCEVRFNIPKVIFQEKETGRILGTGTWTSGLWYMDREGMDATLTSIVEKACMRANSGMSAKDELMLYHRRMGHPSFGTLKFLYPSLVENVDGRFFVIHVNLENIHGVLILAREIDALIPLT